MAIYQKLFQKLLQSAVRELAEGRGGDSRESRANANESDAFGSETVHGKPMRGADMPRRETRDAKTKASGRRSSSRPGSRSSGSSNTATENAAYENTAKEAARNEAAKSWAFRRRLVGGASLVMLLVAGIGYFTGRLEDWTGSASTSQFTLAALTRIGLVLGAMWLAWDSLRKPARWLPPGLAVIGVVGIVMVAAQPKLIIAILPMFGVITVLTSVLRAFRRES
ncbi:hypothetical protein [Rhodopirellula sp. SWK7]|uniref:hypothetical protein n=1 Tax=Rhodopirellula sp. SWK7 TaxID=595460 RepID=UPI0002BF5513|nr:hypothetical protein [Rhodopirellula sp. SWK7]EMI41045.1 putative membrane protein [Rhodopirellula sp. SWK7]